ncbi:hypothetical protein LTR94_031974, partial [Friedmanniomyces endolithicus]
QPCGIDRRRLHPPPALQGGVPAPLGRRPAADLGTVDPGSPARQAARPAPSRPRARRHRRRHSPDGAARRHARRRGGSADPDGGRAGGRAQPARAARPLRRSRPRRRRRGGVRQGGGV